MPGPAAPITVIVAFYATDTGASKVLGALRRLHDAGDAELVGAATMIRDEPSARLKIGEALDVGEADRSPGETPGRLIDMIFPPAILALGAVGAAANAADEHFGGQGFQDNLLKELGENMPAGGSALVAVIEEKWVERFGDLIAGYADLERFTPDPKAAAHLRERSRPDSS